MSLVLKPLRIGILGAGQLGCMLSESLFRLGAEVHFFDPDKNAPGRLRSPFFTCAPWKDVRALQTFFESCDVVTFEFENVDPLHLEEISRTTQVPIYPDPKVLKVTQNREREKSFVLTQGLPCGAYVVARTAEDLADFQKDFRPAIAKALTGGYDGKGQWKIASPADLEAIAPHLPVILEEPLQLVAEASVIVARNPSGQSTAMGPFDNVHVHHALDHTIVPSALSSDLKNALVEMALEASQNISEHGCVGLLTTEFFICRKPSQWPEGSYQPSGAPVQGKAGSRVTQLKQVGEHFVGINEFAPRPHNSGHVSRLAWDTSQFDLHALALLNLPFPEQVPARASLMINLYGQHFNEALANGPTSAETSFPPEFCLYGKEEARIGRKMGHFSVPLTKSSPSREDIEKFVREQRNLVCHQISKLQRRTT